MLADRELFAGIERTLREEGHIQKFEEECGPIKGRMMITVRKAPPEGIKIDMPEGMHAVCFEATFDFYNSAIGVAMNTRTMETVSDFWISPQTDRIEEIDHAWVEFFVEKMIACINREDGSYVDHAYSFVNDTSDLTIIPTIDDLSAD